MNQRTALFVWAFARRWTWSLVGFLGLLAAAAPGYAEPPTAGGDSQAEQPGEPDDERPGRDANDDSSAGDTGQSFDEDELFDTPDVPKQSTTGQREGPRRIRRVDEPPLDQMDRQQARKAGFVFGDQDQESSRISTTFLAATAGLLVHGLGHWYAGDKRTSSVLFAAEGASLALVGSAFLGKWASGNSTASQIYAGPALYLGVGLFGMSYLLDIIGTVEDTDIGLPADTRRTKGIAVSADYSYLTVDGYGDNRLQMLTAGATFDLGWGYIKAQTDQDVYLDTAMYGATLGARLWRGAGRHTFGFVEAGGQWLRFSKLGRFGRIGGDIRAGVSLGLGRWISQLRRVAVGAAIGYGRQWFRLPAAGQPGLGVGFSNGYIPVDMFVHFNLTDRLNTRVGYEHRPGRLMESSAPGLAVGSVEFLYRSTDMLDLVLRGEVGGGLSVTGGLRVWFWQ